MDIEVRFALTGHSRRIADIKTAHQLMSEIKQSFGIEFEDQKLIGKTGIIMKSNENFEDGSRFQKTLANTEVANPDTLKMSPVICFYLYNRKDMLKCPEIIQQNEDDYWITLLKQNCKQLFPLRENVFDFKAYEEIFIRQRIEKKVYEKYEIFQLGCCLHQNFRELADLSNEFKQSQLQILQKVALCENQRKATQILTKNLANSLQSKIKKRINAIDKAIKQQNSENDDALRQNSSFFENRRHIDSIGQRYKVELDAFNLRTIDLGKEIKECKRVAKQKFKVSDGLCLTFDGQNCKHKKIIERIQNELKESYALFLEDMRQLSKDEIFEDNIKSNLSKWSGTEENTTEAKELSHSLLEFNTKAFINLGKQHETNQRFMMDAFKHYEIVEGEIIQLENQLKKMEREIKKYIGNANSEIQRHSPKKEIPNGIKQQILQRIEFITNFQMLTQYIGTVCKEEAERRYKFESFLKNNRISLEKVSNLLKSSELPQFTVDYSNSSDSDLLWEYKDKQKPTKLTFEKYVLEKTKSISDEMKQLLQNQGSARIKNVEEILSKASDIYHTLYSRKLDAQLKICQKNMQEDYFRKEVDLKKSSMEAISLNSQVIEQLENKLEEAKRQIILLNEQLQQAAKLAKQKEEKYHLEKSSYEAIKKEQKKLKNQLLEQLQCSENLCKQLEDTKVEKEEIEQELQEIKIEFGDREIRIIKLEDECNQLRRLSNSKGCEEKIGQQQINQQKIVLQREIERLYEQNIKLEEDLNNLIMKDTQDQEVQVNPTWEGSLIHTKSAQSLKGRASITVCQNEPLQEGELYLFLPFNNQIYVAANFKSPERHGETLNTTKQLERPHCNFVFDIKSQPMRVRDLLSQCSLVIAVRVNGIQPGEINLVKGKIEYALGFEDQDITMKNYSTLFYD